ncbi:MAG: hypothetical protein NTZ78_14590 [Candidatus Aureabacteria bacterium]|nr:hypothetical protein [Candidatus Auribacterota bacterium]
MTLKLRMALTFLSIVAFLFLLVWQRRVFPKPVERALDNLRVWWLGVAKKIGHVQSVIILTVFYFTVIAVASLVSRCAGKDFLRLKDTCMWHPRKRKKDTIETLQRQF